MPAIVAVFVVAWLVVKAPRAIAEMVADLRASKAGAWDHLAGEHARRDASRAERREARRRAYAAVWDARRELRSRQAGGDGTYRPGMRAYLGDVYGGFWRRRIEVRRAREQAREPYVHDPNRPPWHERADAKILGWLGRVGSAVRGERAADATTAKPTPEPDAVDEPQVEPVAATDLPPGTWTVGADGERVALATPVSEVVHASDEYVARPAEGGWRWACRTCGRRGGPYATEGEARSAASRDGHSNGCHPQVPQQAEAVINQQQEEPVTAPTTAPITVDEVTSNEALRRNAEVIRNAAVRGKDALAALEAARQEIAAAAQASADGVDGKRFDQAATAAAHEVNDQINLGTLSQWAEVLDNVEAAAERVHGALDKFRDAEDVVASNNVDGSTLEPTAA